MSRFLFVVQGEGRGHLTQAISLSAILRQAGHEVVAVLVGKGEGNALPDFFRASIQAPVHTFASPSLVYGQGKALRVWDTIRTHLLRGKDYFKSIRFVADQVAYYQPDMVVNFYEMICGFYFAQYKTNIPCVCIAHQYLLLHEGFETLPNKWLDRALLNLTTHLTALGSTEKLALSFVEMPHDEPKRIKVVPPLLRKEVKNLVPQQGDFILAYITHHKLAEDIINWHENHRHVKIHCFWNNPDFAATWAFRENLVFHQVNAQKFMQMMQECAGLVCTAGFESVCEAMYMGKPLMMVPVPNHIEQAINALDGSRAGAGIADDHFNFDRFLAYLPQHQSVQESFVAWQNQSDTLFVKHLESLIQPTTEVFTLKSIGAYAPRWKVFLQKYF